MKRPYRLYNAQTKTYLRWRCYGYPRHAHIGALIECRWAEVSHTIEVLDTTEGAGNKLLGSYTRRVDGVAFSPERNAYVKPKRSRKSATRKQARRRAETIDRETGEVRASQTRH